MEQKKIITEKELKRRKRISDTNKQNPLCKFWLGKKLSESHKNAIKEGVKKAILSGDLKMSKRSETIRKKCIEKNSKFCHPNGYILIYAPHHPYCHKENYVYEHRVVMEKNIGRYLNSKEVVHHINSIRDDNRVENLMLFPDRKTHQKFHKKTVEV